jgi:hypothetical protein
MTTNKEFILTESDLERSILRGGSVLVGVGERTSQVGPLTVEQLAKLMTACVTALDKIYPVPAKSSLKSLTQKVDSRGRYGAYKLTIQQLVDSGYIDKEVIAWGQEKLQNSGDGPYTAERRTSYADEAMKEYDDIDFDFAVPRTEERNNLQYYLIKNEPPAYINTAVQTYAPISSFIDSTLIDQNFWAYSLIEFTYKLFITARIIDEDLLLNESDLREDSIRALSGLLAVAICDSYDAAISLANGKEKFNTDGIGSKYWYSIGWNAITDPSQQKPFDEPEPVKSPDITAIANVSSDAISEEPTPETASAPISTTTDSGNPSAVPESSDTPPPPVTAEAVASSTPPAKPMSYRAQSTGEGYLISYTLDDVGLYFGADVQSLGFLVATGLSETREELIRGLLSKIDKVIRGTDQNHAAFLPLTSARNDLANNFFNVTEPLLNQKNAKAEPPPPSQVNNPDGTTSTTTTTIYSDGSKTTITETISTDGTVSKQKEITPVSPPADVSPPKVADDLEKVRNPADSSAAVATSSNSIGTYGAANQPSNADVVANNDPSKGFKDPTSQYPKKDSINKPDTNTLAVGINSPSINADPRSPAGDRKSMSPGASPAARNASRKREVRKAGRNGTSWSQPESPYAAQYPYNKVFAGESGHALEIDDTPGAERLNFAHRSGSFDEIGPDGTKVSKIVGDGYTIYENDGYILIEGSANVHLAGTCNVFIAGDTNLSMHGKASIDVHNDLDLNVGGHIAVSAGKGIFVRNQGIFSLDNKGDVEIRSKGKMTQEVVGTYNVTTTGGYNMTSKANSNVKISGISYTTSTGDMNFCTDGVFKAKSAGDMNMLTAAVMNQESTGAFNNKSGAAVNVEGTGNINLKAPLVASSPIDTPTLDVTTANVSTLNAGSTNLRATGTDTGTNGGSTHDLPISGPTSASVTAPTAAASAAVADCASVAPLSKTVAIELPVSISVGSGSASGTGANATGGAGGGGRGGSASSYDGPAAERGFEPDEDINECPPEQGGDGGTTNPVDSEGSGGGSEASGPFQSRPPFGNSDVQDGKRLPTIPSKQPDMSFRLSNGNTLKDMMITPNGKYQIIKSTGKYGVVDQLNYMRALCVHFIDPIQKQFPGVIINSGYRDRPAKNGSKFSAHMVGAAVDLRFAPRPNDGRKHLQIAEWIAKNLPRADQILFEKENGRYWVHVGLVRPSSGAVRGEKMTFLNHNPYGNKSGQVFTFV